MNNTADQNFDPSIVDSLNHPWAIELRNILSDRDNVSPQIIIDDEENILQAIKGNVTVTHVFTTDKPALNPKFLEQLPSSVTILEVAKRTCKKIFDSGRSSSLFAIALMPTQANITSLQSYKKDMIVLDSLSITGNIGAIIRTANAFSVDALVFLNTDYHRLFDRRIIRASRGYLFRIPLIATTPDEFLAFCQDQAIKMVVTSSHAKDPIQSIADTPERLAMIFGAEKEGYTDDTIAKNALQINIPISAEVESLNVSVAASICMFLRNGVTQSS
ncbi:MAG: hypothetical protein NXI01_05625 [Gammaproteobacteria bacterium]|nr:hypothetical protein [Gammaproteobacteria bacterium]